MAGSLSHSCHFSSAALFPLSASYTLQRLHRKAWLPLRLLRRLAAGAQVSRWRGLPAQSGPPPGLSQSSSRLRGWWSTRHVAMLSLGYLGSQCLG